jgi:hypothetical protein
MACRSCIAWSGEPPSESSGATASGPASPAAQARTSLSLKAISMVVPIRFERACRLAPAAVAFVGWSFSARRFQLVFGAGISEGAFTWVIRSSFHLPSTLKCAVAPSSTASIRLWVT